MINNDIAPVHIGPIQANALVPKMGAKHWFRGWLHITTVKVSEQEHILK